MHKSAIFIVCLLAVTLTTTPPVFGSICGKIAKEAIEQTLKKAAQKSGREIFDQGARKAAGQTLERLTKTYGDDVLKVVDDSGIELLEAVPKYGDDIVEIAMKASPEARRAFAKNIPDMLPLARRFGTEALELEAKSPGMVTEALRLFDDDAAKSIVRNVPKDDIPRFLQYANKADNNETRKILLETYKKEGTSLFQRIPPSLVVASGLTAAMLLATERGTQPIKELSDKLRDLDPDRAVEVIKNFITSATKWGAVVILIVIILILWRFGLMPWHRKNTRETRFTSRKMDEHNRQEIYDKNRDNYSDSKKDVESEDKPKEKSDDQMIV